ncbi:unnamed protein product [Ectocarpus fasciculatus]
MGMEGASGTTASAAGAALVLSRRIDEVVLPPGRGLRVHSLSDLHTDSKDNLAWVKSLASWKGDGDGELGEGHEDVLIVAGDISSSLERSAETLECLMERYDEVFFVVGNHEMWTGRRKPEGGIDSVEKLVQMHRLCESLGVRTDPVVFAVGGEGKSGAAAERGTSSEENGGATGGRQELAVFPLLSWYHASWDDEPNLPPELQLRRGNFLRRWRDYSYCHWPEDLCSREDFVTVDRDAPPVIAEFFARQNDGCIQAFRATKSSTRARVPPLGEDGEGGGGGLLTLSLTRRGRCRRRRLVRGMAVEGAGAAAAAVVVALQRRLSAFRTSCHGRSSAQRSDSCRSRS